MSAREGRRSVDAILDDIDDAAQAAKDLKRRGKQAWDHDRLLRLAGEAIIGRIADAATRLPDEVKQAMPNVPWDDIRSIRILVDHIYHRVDHEALWETVAHDIPELQRELRAWRTGR